MVLFIAGTFAGVAAASGAVVMAEPAIAGAPHLQLAVRTCRCSATRSLSIQTRIVCAQIFREACCCCPKPALGYVHCSARSVYICRHPVSALRQTGGLGSRWLHTKDVQAYMRSCLRHRSLLQVTEGSSLGCLITDHDVRLVVLLLWRHTQQSP